MLSSNREPPSSQFSPTNSPGANSKMRMRVVRMKRLLILDETSEQTSHDEEHEAEQPPDGDHCEQSSSDFGGRLEEILEEISDDFHLNS